MPLQSLKSWHWTILSIVLGVAIALLRGQTASDLAGTFGESINSQLRFEQAMVSSESGRPRFSDISVHARRVPDGKGGTRPVHLVSGRYFNGQYEHQDGKVVAKWYPAFFLADVPYRPAMNVILSARLELGARFNAIAQPTVMDYLDCLHASNGVTYTHAWWLSVSPWTWAAVTVVLVGVAWPLTYNLLTFGSLRRPREAKGIDLSKVHSGSGEAKPTTSTTADHGYIAALEAEMLENLAEQSEPAPTAAAGQPPAPRKLVEVPVAAVPAVSQSASEFGAEKEDFYPTALHVPHDDPRRAH